MSDAKREYRTPFGVASLSAAEVRTLVGYGAKVTPHAPTREPREDKPTRAGSRPKGKV